jgi:hypothetical protein
VGNRGGGPLSPWSLLVLAAFGAMRAARQQRRPAR